MTGNDKLQPHERSARAACLASACLCEGGKDVVFYTDAAANRDPWEGLTWPSQKACASPCPSGTMAAPAPAQRPA